MRARDGVDRVLSVALVAAAVVMAAAVTYREFASQGQAAIPRQVTAAPEYHDDWRSFLSNARYLTDSVAPVHLIEFGDLECPACRRFHEVTIPALQARFGSQIAISFVHLPLAIHRFARLAAHASECAASQERFAEFVNVTFANQDSLGLKSWSSLAVDASIPDTAAFSTCRGRPEAATLVDSGLALSRRLRINSTPTVMVNGWRVPGPSLEELSRVTIEVLERRKPFP